MSIIAGKDGMDVPFLLCTTPNAVWSSAVSPTDSLGGLVTSTSKNPAYKIYFVSTIPTDSDLLTEEIQKARKKREKCNES